uniref:Transmembrane protein n=1 Tax=Heterorhabditis bacteriophora TaxID=37862 RepID=A0A1I7X5M6_HETBA
MNILDVNNYSIFKILNSTQPKHFWMLVFSVKKLFLSKLIVLLKDLFNIFLNENSLHSFSYGGYMHKSQLEDKKKECIKMKKCQHNPYKSRAHKHRLPFAYSRPYHTIQLGLLYIIILSFYLIVISSFNYPSLRLPHTIPPVLTVFPPSHRKTRVGKTY